MWIFVEGLHLYILIMISVFSERSCVRWYILLGWGKYELWSAWFVLRVSILPFSRIFVVDFGTVPTAWYFCFFHFIINYDNHNLDYYCDIEMLYTTSTSGRGVIGTISYYCLVMTKQYIQFVFKTLYQGQWCSSSDQHKNPDRETHIFTIKTSINTTCWNISSRNII